ncbi:MAG: ABC transporter permease [Turicibacter sp.]|nr:ABC transporter permease [Turicibacter sp.]
MKKVFIILKDLFAHFGIVFRISKYEDRATYQSHYLGVLWQILNPLIQIGIYYVVFGLATNRGGIGGVSYMAWMLPGISVWFCINNSTLGSSNSIHQKIGMVSKMKFPVSILPAVSIMSQMTTFAVMMGISIVWLLVSEIYPTFYWLQFIYYFICLVVLLYFCGILNATLTVLVRDYHIALQSLMRILFYFSGAVWNITGQGFPPFVNRAMMLNPFLYIIEGFRDALLSRGYFFEKGSVTLFFWLFVLFVAILGSHLHLKFRSKFVDFV